MSEQPHEAVEADTKLETVPATPVLLTDGLPPAELDTQINLARKYRRDPTQAIAAATEEATCNLELADKCRYEFSRGGKKISGPSATLASILAQKWGNLRIIGEPVGEEENNVVARGMVHDLETNVAIAITAKRRITDKNGRRFNHDMIAVTMAACVSIAIRQATLRIIPKGYVKEIEEKICVRIKKGDKGESVTDRVDWLIRHFAVLTPPCPIDLVLAYRKVSSPNDLNEDDIVSLKGLYVSLKDGITSVSSLREELMPDPGDEPQTLDDMLPKGTP